MIRGFNQEKYAQEIRHGIIGFRDLLTTLLYHENNGYKYSNYYEKYLVDALSAHDVQNIDFCDASVKVKEQLKLIFDPFIPHFYLSYFHILNENSEEWLENGFEDNSYFIYAEPNLQKLDMMDEMMYGKNMLGSRMVYLPKDGAANTTEMFMKKVGIIWLIQNELNESAKRGGVPFEPCMYLSSLISAVGIEAFARRCDGRYNQEENEFRIIYKAPTPYNLQLEAFEALNERVFDVIVEGITYKGAVWRNFEPSLCGLRRIYNMYLQTDNPLAATYATTLKGVIDEGKKFVIQPHFLSVDMNGPFKNYGYIGNKEQCREFIRKKL